MPKKATKEIIRVTFRFHGPELEQVREVREMLSLNSELDAARYLMQRGLEALTPTLTSRRSQNKMASGVAPTEVLAALKSSGMDLAKVFEGLAK
jgi:hypothetical protein